MAATDPFDPFVAPTEYGWPEISDISLQQLPLSAFPCAKWTSELVTAAGRCVGVDINSLQKGYYSMRDYMHDNVSFLKAEITAIREQLDEPNQDPDAVKDSLAGIRTELDQLMSELPLNNTCTDSHSRKETDMADLRATLDTVRADVDVIMKYERHSALIATIEAQFTRLQSENALRDVQIRDLDQRDEVKRLVQDNARLEARLCALEEKEEATQAAFVARDKSLKACMDRIQSSHDELQATVLSIREEITELENANLTAALTQVEKDVEECNEHIAELRIRTQATEKTATRVCALASQSRSSVEQIRHETKEQRAVCTVLRSDHDTLRSDHETLCADHHNLHTNYQNIQAEHQTLRTDHETLHTSVQRSIDMLLGETQLVPSRAEMDAIQEAIALLQSQLPVSSSLDHASVADIIRQDINRLKENLRAPTDKFVYDEGSMVYSFLELFALLDQTCAVCRGPKDTGDLSTCVNCASLSLLKPKPAGPERNLSTSSTVKPQVARQVDATVKDSSSSTNSPTSTMTEASQATTSTASGISTFTSYSRDVSPLTDIDEKEDREDCMIAPDERRLSSRKRMQRTFEGPSQRYPHAKRPRTKANRAPLWLPRTPQGQVPMGMISCDRCHGWLHNRCAGFTHLEALTYATTKKRFLCPFCVITKKQNMPFVDRTPKGKELCIREDCTIIPDPNVYDVERILGRFRWDADCAWNYLIKWAGYPVEQSTWEDGSGLTSCIEKFHKRAAKEGFSFESSSNFVLAVAQPFFALAGPDDPNVVY